MTEKSRSVPPGKSAARNAEADLAFLRQIVESGGGGRRQMAMGVLFLVCGLLYGVQCLFHLGQIAGLIRWPDWASLAFVVAITLGACLAIAWTVVMDRRSGVTATRGPTVGRAMNSAFSATGLGNLAIIVIFGLGSARDGDFAVWLYYPAIVFAFQSMAWFVAWTLKRKAWMGLVAAGHWTTAVALGLLVREPVAYLWITTAALFLLFALPGAIILRDALRAEA
ncbi:MAG: hypothetical protein KKG14_00975 [Alphaproteobacteria bacterium]|nr:hypothetical protein [Alphaproteobacteria bacterium]MBU2270240.1 hypothetical protein [Alphaproteobacteria bacterium]MBU2417262.1 hypothetical protein [Alphaproteobacteria bacterium]